MTKKIVLYPIVVPTDKFCWSYAEGDICKFFDNHTGGNICALGFHIPVVEKENPDGIVKATECLVLEEMESN